MNDAIKLAIALEMVSSLKSLLLEWENVIDEVLSKHSIKESFLNVNLNLDTKELIDTIPNVLCDWLPEETFDLLYDKSCKGQTKPGENWA